MEVHQLRYFVAVAQEGGFSRAAGVMRVAQPSLSQQIQKLEAEVGQPLFERRPRGVNLTEAGQRLMPFARRILADLGDARRSVEECHRGVAGTVAVGIIPTIAPYVVRPLLRDFTAAHPGVVVQIQEDVTERLVRALGDGGLDLAIVSTCRSHAATTHREFWQHEPLLMVVPEDHPAATRGRACAQVLHEEPFLALEESHCLSQQISRWCHQQGIHRQTTLPAVQLATIVAMVAAGQGVSLLPAMAVAHEAGEGCAFLPLSEPVPGREINVLRNPARFQTRAAMAFANLARRVVSEAVASGVTVDQRGGPESNGELR